MNQFLTIFLVVFAYFAVSFTLLGICALIVNYTYPHSKYNNHHNNQQAITTTNKINRVA